MNENRMNTAERDELQQTARRILAERAPIERVRSLLDDDLGHFSLITFLFRLAETCSSSPSRN